MGIRGPLLVAFFAIAAATHEGEPDGCPMCTCGAADLKLWPFSGCDVKCGARCPDVGCCCISGAGICPRSGNTTYEPSNSISETKVADTEIERKAAAVYIANGPSKAA